MMEERDHNMARRGRRSSGAGRLIPLLWIVLIALCIGAVYWMLQEAFQLEPSREEMPPDDSVTVIDTPQSGEDTAETSDTDTPWYLALVNRWNPLPEDYAVDLVEVPGGEKVDQRIYDPLMEMLDAAEAEDLGPIVVSGFRTEEKQQSLYDDKIREYRQQGYSQEEAVELAEQWVARPGTSEHQLGLAVDINGAVYDIYLWLEENSWKYGFIFRYPDYKTDLTGVAGEVWHYRYVGKEAAQEIYEQGVCLEEYLENLPEDGVSWAGSD